MKALLKCLKIFWKPISPYINKQWIYSKVLREKFKNQNWNFKTKMTRVWCDLCFVWVVNLSMFWYSLWGHSKGYRILGFRGKGIWICTTLRMTLKPWVDHSETIADEVLSWLKSVYIRFSRNKIKKQHLVTLLSGLSLEKISFNLREVTMLC